MINDKSEMTVGFCKGAKEAWGHLKIMNSLGNEANEKYHVYVCVECETEGDIVCMCV